MELTLSFIETSFHKFNKQYFGNKLKTPEFKITKTKNTLGQCSWKNFGSVKYDFVIKISKYFDRDEKAYNNTILHEMIHLYIRQNNLKDTNKHHGKLFYSIADRINKDGWNIARTDSVVGFGLTDDVKQTYCMVTFMDKKGKYFLMRYNPAKRSYYISQFAKFKFTGIIWFNSTDSKKYAHFPECRKGVRGFFITELKYKEIEKIDPYKFAV